MTHTHIYIYIYGYIQYNYICIFRILPNKKIGRTGHWDVTTTWLPQLLWWRPSFSVPPATLPAPQPGRPRLFESSKVIRSPPKKWWSSYLPPTRLNMWGEMFFKKNMLKQNYTQKGTFQWPKHHALQQFWRYLLSDKHSSLMLCSHGFSPIPQALNQLP